MYPADQGYDRGMAGNDDNLPLIDAALRDAVEQRASDPAAEIEQRIQQLRLASRPNEPLTDRDGPTVQGHVASAITKLERMRDAAYRSKR